MMPYSLSDPYPLLKLAGRIVSLQLLQLGRRVLVQELINGEVATAHADVNLVLIDLDHDTLASELVDTFGLTHEKDLHLFAIGVVVDVLSDLAVNLVVFHRDVDCDARFEVQNVVLKHFDFVDQLLVMLVEVFILARAVLKLV